MTENVPPLSQCLRGLHFIEAWIIGQRFQRTCCRSFFGNCTSLRPGADGEGVAGGGRSFFGNCTSLRRDIVGQAQEVFLGRSFFGNCTSLRLLHHWSPSALKTVVVPSGTALH